MVTGATVGRVVVVVVVVVLVVVEVVVVEGVVEVVLVVADAVGVVERFFALATVERVVTTDRIGAAPLRDGA